MTDTQKKYLTAFNAWLDRWELSNKEASMRLSMYRKVTPEQVQKMREGLICPSIETFSAWAVEISSSPKTEKYEIPDFMKNLFGNFKGGF
jgi:hypothetical protein